MHHTCAIKRHTPEIVNGISFDISIDEDPSLRIDSFAIIHLPGVSTKLTCISVTKLYFFLLADVHALHF